MTDPDQYKLIRRRLLTWFDRNARDLPWRHTQDPYAIWLSEIMLQQTQVETVRDYYTRFLNRLPTVHHFAKAPLDTILKLWEGLGYYTRARNAHKAAKQVTQEFGGEFPSTLEGLQQLSGVGRYTAGAIASIAFGVRAPIVDGNVVRILCRIFCLHGDPTTSSMQKRLWALASDLVPVKRPGDFNEAMMELGATVCHRQSPACELCPLKPMCRACQQGIQMDLPERVKRRPRPTVQVAVGVIYKRGRILIDKRPPEGLLGGLWEFPGGKKKSGESFRQALKREVREELDIEILVNKKLVVVDHAYTHFQVQLHVYVCEFVSGEPQCLACTDIKWVLPSQLARYAFPTANRKIFPVLLRG
ncbi:MAG: A/G-specific adenine glycosylase [Phycisphaerae bacterium]|nr:A/G-specific adenine glycosylase [Phycisphaerae bacterium]